MLKIRSFLSCAAQCFMFHSVQYSYTVLYCTYWQKIMILRMAVTQSMGPSLWSRLNYLTIYHMDCYDILYRRLWYLEDASW